MAQFLKLVQEYHQKMVNEIFIRRRKKELLSLIETEIEKNDPNVLKYFLEGAKDVLRGSKRRSI